MGYRGKAVEQGRARDLRAQGWTLSEICEEVGVARSSHRSGADDVEIEEQALLERRRDAASSSATTVPASAARTSFSAASSMRSSGCATGPARANRPAERTRVPDCRSSAVCGRRSETRRQVAFPNTDPRMLLFFVPGCGTSSRSRRAAFGSALPPRGTGPRGGERVLVRLYRYSDLPVRQAIPSGGGSLDS